LIESDAHVLLVRAHRQDRHAIGTFDYQDLNQYLLFATGLLVPDDEHLTFFQDLASRAQRGAKIPLKDAKSLGNKEPFVTLPHTAQLARAVEIFGGGVHRVILVRPESHEIVGVLSQARLIRFLWENGASFPVIDQLYPRMLRELNVGALDPICIKWVMPRPSPWLLAD
jgi:hypothetical protein